MAESVKFFTTVVGLTVRFTNTSSSLLEGQSFEWNFGDGTTSIEKDPVHLYGATGSFFVSLYLKQCNTTISTYTQEVKVTDKVKTQLSGSIYDLIDQYIPSDIFGTIDFSVKRLFIQKWQLYLQPLVNHEVPLDEYSNELYYEALENQLIMELAAYDFLSLSLANSLKSTAVSITGSSPGSTGDVTVSESRVKKISTGPTEVEYFDSSDTESTVIKSLQSSGILDMIKQNICMLSDRLDIYLPICRSRGTTVVPQVVNRRSPGPLDGPDPSYPINK